MADVLGNNFSKIGTTDVIPRGLWNSLVLVQADEYEAVALAADSTIKVAKLPKGAKVLDVILIFGALGGGVTLSVGYAGAANRYIDSVSGATAGRAQMNLVAGAQDELTEDKDIIITIGGAAASGVIKSIILFSL